MRKVFAVLLAMSALFFAGARAQAGDAVLAVSGTSAAGPVRVSFDLAALDALPQRAITTSTPWYEGTRTFSGPDLKLLIDGLGLQGQTVRVVALNDYAATLPYADLEQFGVVLASRVDGQPLSVREKGPLFVMYPFDTDAKLRQETYYSRAVWQVAKIELAQ
jgi:hypothetical protein